MVCSSSTQTQSLLRCRAPTGGHTGGVPCPVPASGSSRMVDICAARCGPFFTLPLLRTAVHGGTHRGTLDLCSGRWCSTQARRRPAGPRGQGAASLASRAPTRMSIRSIGGRLQQASLRHADGHNSHCRARASSPPVDMRWAVRPRFPPRRSPSDRRGPSIAPSLCVVAIW
jgi:hypothetical protein